MITYLFKEFLPKSTIEAINPTNISFSMKKNCEFYKLKYMDNSFDVLYFKAQVVDVDTIIAISKNYSDKTIVVLKQLNYNDKRRLINNNVAFLLENKEFFIPYFVHIKNTSNKKVEKFSPSTQMIFTYILNNIDKEYSIKILSKVMDITDMSISRSLHQLYSIGVLKLVEKGGSKIYSAIPKDQFFKIGLKYCINPIRKKVYNVDVDTKKIVSGNTALSLQTNLVDYDIKEYGIYTKISILETKRIDYEQVISIYKYDINKLAINNIIDDFTLYLLFKDDKDPRVIQELDILLMEHGWMKN